MKIYARISDGRVIEIIEPAVWEDSGGEIPIEERFTSEFVETLVDITNVEPTPLVGDLYDGVTFSTYVAPPPSAKERLASNSAIRDGLLQQAATALAPLQMAVALGEATDDETAQAKAWVTFSRAVKAIDLTQEAPQWPSTP